MDDLLLVVPSRGRPLHIRRLWDAMEETCTARTKLIVGLDDDDPHLAEYLVISRPVFADFAIRSGLRQVVAWVNHLARQYAPGYRAVGHIGDDNLPSTPGWDTAILSALNSTPFAFGNDLYPREPGSLCCHIFTRSEVVAKLDYLGPPSLRHMFVDPVWMAWGKACGITYLPEVILEHLHWSSKGFPPDQTYQDAAACWDADHAAFVAYCDDPGGLNADIVKLGGTPFTPAEISQFKVSLNIR